MTLCKVIIYDKIEKKESYNFYIDDNINSITSIYDAIEYKGQQIKYCFDEFEKKFKLIICI